MKKFLKWIAIVLVAYAVSNTVGGLLLPDNWASETAQAELEKQGRGESVSTEYSSTLIHALWGSSAEFEYAPQKAGERSVAKITVSFWRPLSLLDWQVTTYEEVPTSNLQSPTSEFPQSLAPSP